jgi:hypothetical protein
VSLRAKKGAQHHLKKQERDSNAGYLELETIHMYARRIEWAKKKAAAASTRHIVNGILNVPLELF